MGFFGDDSEDKGNLNWDQGEIVGLSSHPASRARRITAGIVLTVASLSLATAGIIGVVSTSSSNSQGHAYGTHNRSS